MERGMEGTHLVKLVLLDLVVVDKLDVLDGALDLGRVVGLVLGRDVEALGQVPIGRLEHATASRDAWRAGAQPVLVPTRCARRPKTRQGPHADAHREAAAAAAGGTESIVGGPWGADTQCSTRHPQASDS